MESVRERRSVEEVKEELGNARVDLEKKRRDVEEARLSEVLKVHASKHFESVKGGCTILYTFYKTHQF